jgi:hypothetical protein
MKIIFKILSILVFSGLLHAQDSTEIKFSFSQMENIFTSPIASMTESRIGLIKDFRTSKIRMDIGASPDIIKIDLNNKICKTIALGADFHAFGLLFNESDKIILQVDAIDAFFGGHISLKNIFRDESISARIRIMHLSSHLVDGHYDLSKNEWKEGKNPIAFGREFLEFHTLFQFRKLSFYIGMNYIFRQRPDVLTKANFEIAGDCQIYELIPDLVNIYFGYDFKLNGVQEKYCGNNNIEVGFRFGLRKGIKIFYQFYSGNSYYGEYYNEKLHYSGIGFNIFL